MKPRSDKASPSRTNPSRPPAPTIPPEEENWLDRAAAWWFHFDRFGWDALGVTLLAVALMTLIGLVAQNKPWAQGVFLSLWIHLLRYWLGEGAYAAAIVIAVLGLIAMRRHFPGFPRFNMLRIVALEFWVFTLLALLAISGGQSLERAGSGLDGGLIGWGLADLIASALPLPWSTIILGLLLVFLTLFGFGIIQLAIRGFEAWLLADVDVSTIPIHGTIQKSDQAQEDVPQQAPSVTSQLGQKGRRHSPAMQLDKPQSVVSIRRDERLPPLNILMQEHTNRPDEVFIHATASVIETTLAEFGVPSRVTGFRVGPTVTQYAVEPGFVEKTGLDGEIIRQKVRVSQISALARDLALALSAERLRIEAPVPGQSFVGIEVPNQQNAMVRLRPLLETEAFQKLGPYAVALGRDVSGQLLAADLTRMPHLLIAGTTGSGKSVCIAALTICLVMNNTPGELRLAILDPKMVELARFNGMPHLLGKVESETERMLAVLRWTLTEMDRRYRLLEGVRARDLDSYNRRMTRRKQETLPRIVVLIDELADLMMSAPDQTEHAIVRLAQMARATGIHLVVATQRPSTDVVTGLIKANFPARISFNVASSIDSRVILDTNGAETLLGRGDMLFLNPEQGNPVRAQGVMVTDQEVERVINYWQKMSPAEAVAPPWEDLLEETVAEGSDELIQQAIEVVRTTQHASASLLQRRLRIGYPRAARLIDELEDLGVVGPSQAGGREREVLISEDDEEVDNEEPTG
jgi:S-DNA-T family DNA segregation ATPase FtsK/SpoIIIE